MSNGLIVVLLFALAAASAAYGAFSLTIGALFGLLVMAADALCYVNGWLWRKE